MLRFFVISFIIVNLVLVEGRRINRRKETATHGQKVLPETPRIKARTPRPAVHKETTTQFSNRHRRASLDLPQLNEINEITKDTRPCTLHSIRYGCLCRYGDPKCNSLQDDPIFYSKEFDYLI